MRRFNVTGVCVGHEHYMVDISRTLDEIEKLVEQRQYFTINRARQYGKTTTLLHFEERLNKSGDYICARVTFENAGINAFDTEETFCEMFLEKVSSALEFSVAPDEYTGGWFCPDVRNLKQLDRHIKKMCKDNKVVLMIDEVDKSSNNRLFLHFLGMLRAKFQMRQEGRDYTFHSVILAGVTDIKNLKLKMINDGQYSPTKEEGRLVNSPWNIAASFEMDMSFSSEDIATMLNAYEKDNNTGMDIAKIAGEIYYHTGGYPFLVSRICKHIDEKLCKSWTLDSISLAVKVILKEQSVLFDDLVKNLENENDLYNFMYELHILGDRKSFNLGNRTVGLAHTYGYIKEDVRSAAAVISNRIFERYLTGYFVSKEETAPDKEILHGIIHQDVIRGDKFDMATCLQKFAAHYSEVFTIKDQPFLERQCRLLFLTFLKPLLNGQGNYYIESQFTDQRRMDIVVDFEKEQYIVELKRWKGEASRERAYDQLLGYMDSKNAKEGFMLTFDFRKNRTGEYTSEWVEFDGKRIFAVVV